MWNTGLRFMYDIIIVGGGHAGVEAAQIASQFKDLKIGLISMPGVGLASAPCNPSIGGVGKGQVVREIDALGGMTGILADKAGIQFRTLNESKGYAVQSTRVQIDKVRYSEFAEDFLSKIDNINIIREKVISVIRVDCGFRINTDSSTWNTKKLIFTVGTFLNGKLHTGYEQSSGGRSDAEASNGIENIFSDIKTVPARFKTGTPARLDKDSIDYSQLEEQVSDSSVESFHVLHGTNYRNLKQVSCYLAHTNSETLKTIRINKEHSPMFNGRINAVGARYCPSIEDKAFRYPDKDVHHVFIEPESHELDTVYPSGISTSLPKDVQDDLMKSIVGLEKCKILQYGYAVEYDVVDTTQLDKTLQMISIPGLYFAGQVNGTSGYEEAAGQGLIAGANAALSLMDKEPLILSRNESYIGVMIEDLVSNVRDEPYRLFTARSENRLYIREDNTTLRMAPYRRSFGLLKPVDLYQENFIFTYESLRTTIMECYVDDRDSFCKANDIKVPRRTSMAEILKQPALNPIETLSKFLRFNGFDIDKRIVKTLAISFKYEGYIAKSDLIYKKTQRLDSKKINYNNLLTSENISFECKKRIERIKPDTFGQLRIIEGIRPATLAAVAGSLS